MELNKVNSLVELFFETYKKKSFLYQKPFLKWLKTDKDKFLTWGQVEIQIRTLSDYLKNNCRRLYVGSFLLH